MESSGCVERCLFSPMQFLALVTVWKRRDGKKDSCIHFSAAESEKVQTASPMPLSKADYGSVSPSSFDSPHTHTQEAPLPCSPLSHDLVRIVKISPFDKANWTTCQRMFSSLVNHICSLISTHSRTQQTLHHLIQSTSHCCESSTGSRRGQEETERLRDNERKKERKEVIKRRLGR